MNRGRRVLLTAILAGSGVLATGMTAASPDRPGPRDCRSMEARGPLGHLEKLADELDLSPEQRDRIRELMEQQRPQMRAWREAMRDTHRRLRELERAPTFDEQAIRQLAEQQARTMAEMRVEKAKMHHEIARLLTPEQRERFERMRPRKGPRHRSPGPDEE
ncbi:MAG: periplasmic heavy metal sensor [Gammaproteobacteria bacterium]|nr:MAG: periplasmic heavy metal sensor [Gammaproteobacteria bacterium]